jgi:HEAT repeat protein
MNAFRSLTPIVVIALLAGCATAPRPQEAAALAVLSSSADVHEKARACQELGHYGGPASVPALASLLSHDTLADYARSGLEGIPDASAGAALRNALGTLNGRLLAGVVNSLGVRREVAAVPELQKLALDTQRGVTNEALAALGMIGTADAIKTLQKVLTDGPASLRVPAAEAALVAAEQLAKAGNASAARALLEQVGRAQPSAILVKAAQSQAAALTGPAKK